MTPLRRTLLGTALVLTGAVFAFLGSRDRHDARAPAAGAWQAAPTVPVAGHDLRVVAPAVAAPGRPWVWYGAFPGLLPELDDALLARGFHLVYVDVPDLFGAPPAMAAWEAAYAALVAERDLSPRPALIGISRGGLYVYAWAAAHPDRVACIYGDAPVMDVRSWPAGKGRGAGDPTEWTRLLRVYGFADEAEALAWTGNPVDRLAPLAAAGIPLLHVVGEADDVVPWSENTGVAEARYRALGGSFTRIGKAGIGHHPHGLLDVGPVVDFLVGCALPGGTPSLPATPPVR